MKQKGCILIGAAFFYLYICGVNIQYIQKVFENLLWEK